jgi:tetratricopeptide (TPR) repeat protein
MEYFLESVGSHRSTALCRMFLSDAESILALCAILRRRRNESPAQLAERLPELTSWVEREFRPESFPDEREHFLAQLETTAGVCARWLGRREEAFARFGRAEALFRTTMDAGPGLAELELARFTTRYDMGERSTLLPLIEPLKRRLRSLGMTTAIINAELLEGTLLKNSNRLEESIPPYQRALRLSLEKGNEGLRNIAVGHLADSLALQGKCISARSLLMDVAPTITGKEALGKGFLSLVIGETFRLEGALELALEKYREAIETYKRAGTQPFLAYARLNAAEVLVMMGREWEAESEIAAALPIIERCALVGEGLSAMVLLRESLRRRRADPIAIRQLREHIRTRG